jgi:hypothetical protein
MWEEQPARPSLLFPPSPQTDRLTGCVQCPSAGGDSFGCGLFGSLFLGPTLAVSGLADRTLLYIRFSSLAAMHGHPQMRHQWGGPPGSEGVDNRAATAAAGDADGLRSPTMAPVCSMPTSEAYLAGVAGQSRSF